MIETLKHKEAFEFYYSLGDQRSLPKVGKEYKVTNTSAYKWCKLFNWRDRVKARDTEISKRIEKEVIINIMREKKKFLDILNKQVQDVITKDKDGKLLIGIKIEDQGDLLKTIETSMKLMGDGDGFSDGRPVNITIISAIPRAIVQEKIVNISEKPQE